MYGSGAGTGMAAVAAIPAVQRILQDRMPAVTGFYVAAVGSTAPRAVPSRAGATATPASGAAATASASSDLSGNLLLLPLQSGFAKDTAFFFAKAQKLKNSAQAEFWDCTPVLAFETGIFFGALARGFW